MFLLLANPIFDAYRQSDLFGKVIFIALLFLSIITWVLFLQKFFLQKELKQKGVRLQKLFQKSGNNPLSLDIGEETHPFADLYSALKQHTLDLLNKNQITYLSNSDIETIEAHLLSRIALVIKKLEKNVFILSTIVTLAPFLGLLGTVWGILLTFGELQAGGTLQGNVALMGGLAMALGTTVFGLLVAIPALVAYNYLKASIAHFLGEMETFSHHLVAQVELHYRQVDVRYESPQKIS